MRSQKQPENSTRTMAGGKGREASATEASREGGKDLQQEQIVRPDIKERKDDESLGLHRMGSIEAVCKDLL
jgi:hypothetical protein